MNYGLKISRKNVSVLGSSPTNLQFSSSYLLDKIVLIAVGTNPPHGLGYKPTLITGNRNSNVYIDNYQINGNSGTTKAILLSQQGI